MNTEPHATIAWRKFKNFLHNLNFFPSVPPSTDEHELRIQRISTRVFILLLIISLTILLFYTSLVTSTKSVNVEAPPLAQYEQLYSTYSQTLTCPCTRISINYKTFLHVKYTLHQLCSSIFVGQRWIDYLATPTESILYPNDFRWISPYAFQALRIFCELFNSTISDGLTQFYSNQYVSASVTPLQVFELQTASLVDEFRSTMTNRFLSSFSMIRDTIQANSLLSGLFTNYIVNKVNNDIFSTPRQYDGCLCRSSSTCIFHCVIADYPNTSSSFRVPGFYTGCYVIEALLQSTLEYFYDQRCINALLPYLPPSPPTNVIALDPSLSNRSFPNSTIKQLVDNLMIEQWNVSSIYATYYNECQPTQCTYIVEKRNDVIYIVTTLFGIAGGLTTVLEVVVPRLIKCIMHYIHKRSRRVVPEIPSVQT